MPPGTWWPRDSAPATSCRPAPPWSPPPRWATRSSKNWIAWALKGLIPREFWTAFGVCRVETQLEWVVSPARLDSCQDGSARDRLFRVGLPNTLEDEHELQAHPGSRLWL